MEDYDRGNFKVFQSGDYETLTKAMNEHDLVLLEANYPNVPVIMGSTNKPTVAVVKRAPRRRWWGCQPSAPQETTLIYAFASPKVACNSSDEVRV